MDFNSSDSAQFMMCAIGRIHNGLKIMSCFMHATPDSKVHGAHMGTTWGQQDPGWPHVEHPILAIWDSFSLSSLCRFAHLHWTHTVKDSRSMYKCLLGIFCGSVSKILLVFLVTFLIFFAMHAVVCVKLAHSSLSDYKDIFITHLIIIIKLEVSTFPIVVIFFHGCVY